MYPTLAPLSALLLGPDEDTRQRTIRDIVDPLSSPECNVHLLVFLLDAIVLAIFPELGIPSMKSADYNDIHEGTLSIS